MRTQAPELRLSQLVLQCRGLGDAIASAELSPESQEALIGLLQERLAEVARISDQLTLPTNRAEAA